MVKVIGMKINKQIVANDKVRNQLVAEGKLTEFIKTYTNKYDTKNLNSSVYWDGVFKDGGDFSQQSNMTKDKISLIVNSISQKNLSILDLGIGQGFFEELIANKPNGYKFYGIDISPYSIQRAKKLFSGDFIVGDVLKIDKHFKGKRFDTIVALELLEHISVSKLFDLYNKIHNILKKNGKLIISVPINEHLEKMSINPSAHVRDYSPEILEAELMINGFQVEQKYFLFAFEKHYFIKKILVKLLPKRWQPNSLIIVARKVKKAK